MKKNKNELLESQLKAIGKKKPKPIKISAKSGIAYNVELQRLLGAIHKDVNSDIAPLIKSLAREYTADGWVSDVIKKIDELTNKWSGGLFNKYSKSIANKFVKSANKSNQTKFKREFPSFGVDVFADNAQLKEYLDLSSFDNVALIESIRDKYLGDVRATVVQNMRAGNRPDSIVSELMEKYEVSKRKAKMIARDQTSKINGDLSEKRMRSAGFEYFQWIDSKDSRVRDRHRAIADKVTKYGKGVYRWDDLPLSSDGKRIKPGDDYQDRCTARPVSQREVDKFMASR